MRKVTICKGLPASGKSTWAKDKVKNKPGRTKRINKDDLRAMLDSSHWSKANEKYVLQLRDNMLLECLDMGYNVIIDDTNFHPKHEERIRELVSDYNKGMYGDSINKEKNVQVEVKFFEVDPKEAIERDLKRVNSVGSKVIWKMYNEYLKPEAEKIIPLEQDSSLPHAVICDLDGTLALMNGRKPYDYDKCDTDLVNETIKKVLWQTTGGNNHLIFLSGREASCQAKTIKWLKDTVDINRGYDLYMRKTGDSRKDCIVKREIFDKYIKDKYYIEFILDDRNQVVDMWRKMGLVCLQVAPGDF